MPSLLVQNTAGDRKEIRSMLRRLTPDDRLRFLCECCVLLDRPGVMASARNLPLDLARRDSSADERVTDGVYCDLVFLAAQHGLDLDAAFTRLSAYASRPSGLRANPSVCRAFAAARAVGRAVHRPSRSPG